MTPADKLLTVEQAAERLQMHPATVRRFIREGTLAGKRIGARQWRISESALRDFIDGNHAKPAGE